MVAIAVMVAISGLVLTLNNIRLAYPTLDASVATFSLIAAVVIPVIACFSVTDERKGKSDEYLATLPVSTVQIVLGKILAILAFLMIPNAVICLFPVVIGFFGKTAYLYSYVAILFLIVFEIFIITMSVMFSSLFKKGWVALIVAYADLVVLFFVGFLATLLPEPLEVVARFISPFRRFDSIIYGKFDLSSCLFYLLLSALFVVIAVKYFYSKTDRVRKSLKFKLSLPCLVTAVAVIALSALSALLPSNLRWIDVSANSVYKTSVTTKSFINSLDTDVTLYLIDTDRSEEKLVSFIISEEKLVSFIERYCDSSPRLTLEKVDTSEDTEFRSEHGLSETANLSFCILAKSEKRQKIISADALFKWYNSAYPDLGYMSSSQLQSTISSLGQIIEQYSPYYNSMSSSDKNTFNEYYAMYQALGYYSTRYMDAETVLNEAVEYVTAKMIPTFYFVSGHGEKNTQAGPLDITALTEIPPEASMLFINTPTSDYSVSEVDMLIDYMAKGGRLVIFTNKNNNEMPNLARLLASAGLSVDSETVVDDTCEVTVNSSAPALSLLASNEKVTMKMMGANAILKDTSNSALKYTTLYSRDIEIEGEDGKTKVTEEYGVAVTNNSRPMLIWVTGSDTFNRDQKLLSEEEMVDFGKAMYAVNSMVLWAGKGFTPTVAPNTPVAYDILEFLEIKESDPTFVGTVFVGIIPLIILGAGIYFYWIRRKRSASAE
jgi:ABC-2 type transport system permease protein